MSPNLGRRIWDATKEVLSTFFWNDPFTLSAALSFYTLFSMAPLVLVFTGVIGWLEAERFAREAIANQTQPAEKGYLAQQIGDLTGPAGQEIVVQIQEHGTDFGGGVSLIVGIVTLLFAATAVFVMLQTALNRIWGVEPDPDQGWVWPLVRDRLLSLAMIIVVGFLLLVSLIVSAGLQAAHDRIAEALPGSAALWQLANVLVSYMVITVLIALVYRYMPDARIAWRDVWIGALTTALLFAVGKWAIGKYLGHMGVGSAYGAAGSLVVLLMWVYWASFVIFLGAQITYVFTMRFGSGFRPTSYAISEEEADARRDQAASQGQHPETARPSREPKTPDNH